MHTRLWIAGLLAVTPILALSPVAFPASEEPGCVIPASESRYNQRLFVSLMRRKDTIAERMLSTYNIPRVRASEVRAVTDDLTCERAADAYSRAFGEKSSGRKVHVLRVGDRYIVMDPDYRPDDYNRAVTFDATFSKSLAVVAE